MPCQKVQTVCTIYGALHKKNQKQNFTKIPAGAIGQIRGTCKDRELLIEYFLILFEHNGRMYWAKLNENMFKRIDAANAN